MGILEALGHKAEAVSIEDDKVMYGIYTKRLVLTANIRLAAVVDNNTWMARKGVLIRNCSSVPGDTGAQPATDIAYWGGQDVTPGNGVPLNPGETVILDFRAKKRVEVYVVTDQVTGVQIAVSELL